MAVLETQNKTSADYEGLKRVPGLMQMQAATKIREFLK